MTLTNLLSLRDSVGRHYKSKNYEKLTMLCALNTPSITWT